MYKMVVSDFCGTLINSEEAISLPTMLEIDRVRKAGILFCITTSKSVRFVKDYNRDFPFIDYIVAFNGNYIYDANKGIVLYDKSLSSSVIKKIYKLFSNKSLSFYTLDFCNYTGSYKDKDYSEMLIDVGSFIDENKKEIYKINIYCNSLKEANSIIKKIKDNDIKVNMYIIDEDGIFSVEITNSISNKYKAIEKIAKKHKIKFDDIIAVCSSVSSTCLLEKVGCGCVVSNADKVVRKVANEITDSNEDNGVQAIIKKYF